MPWQTTPSGINAERLEVWHTRFTSPIIAVIVALNAYIIVAWILDCPLTVSRCFTLMNNLISETKFDQDLIKWKIQQHIYNSDPEMPLVVKK